VILRQNRPHLMLANGLALNPGGSMSNQEFSKTEMQTVVDQGLDLIQWRHLFEIDFQAGIFLTKVSKQREKEFRSDPGNITNGDISGLTISGSLGDFFQTLGFAEQLPGFLQQRFARGGESEIARLAVQQGAAEFLFQVADLAT